MCSKALPYPLIHNAFCPPPRTKSVSDIFGGAGKISGLDPAKDFSCLYSDKTASISAHKKGRDIIIRHATLLEKKHYLITGDCLYVWKDGTFEGRKICGIGNRIVLIQTILSAGILNAESLTKMLPENLPIPSGGVLPVGQIQKFLKSCINREINNSDIPAVPKNITFSEAKK